MRWAVMLVLASACATAPAPKKKRAEPERSPREQVERLLSQAYAALESGDPDKARTVFSDDAFVIGLAPSELVVSRDDLLDQLRQQLLPIGLRGDVVHVEKSFVRAALAPGQQSAWLWDLPVISHERGGEATVWLPRITAHALKVDGAWQIDALHVSLGVPDDEVWAPDAARTFLTPSDMKEDRGKDSDELIGLAKRLTEDVAVKVDRVTDAPEALLLGTDPTEVFIGGKRFKELVRPAIAQVKKSGFSTKVEGPVRARLSLDGKTGWVAANVVLRKQTGKKLVTCTPFRALWVFVEEDGHWNLASEHVSLALRESQRKAATPEQRKAVAAVLEAAPKVEPEPKGGLGAKAESGSKSEPGSKSEGSTGRDASKKPESSTRIDPAGKPERTKPTTKTPAPADDDPAMKPW